MNIDYLIDEKWSGQNRTSRTGSAAPVKVTLHNCSTYRTRPKDLCAFCLKSVLGWVGSQKRGRLGAGKQRVDTVRENESVLLGSSFRCRFKEGVGATSVSRLSRVRRYHHHLHCLSVESAVLDCARQPFLLNFTSTDSFK